MGGHNRVRVMKVGFVSFWEIGTRPFEPIETQWIFPIHEPERAHTKGSGTHHRTGQADRNLPGLCRFRHGVRGS